VLIESRAPRRPSRGARDRCSPHRSVRDQRLVGARRLALAAHWADLHAPDLHGPGVRVAGSRRERDRRRHGLRLGADGTPEVSEFAAEELGVLLQTSTGSAAHLLRDALEVRHRLPRVWEAVLAGDLEDWKARKVACATRVLTEEQARWVDGQVLSALLGCAWGPAQTVVEAKVIAADPAGHERRRVAREEKRYVALGRRTPAGAQTLFAHGNAGDQARLFAMVDHLADHLPHQPDHRQDGGEAADADARRAQALALLANPALACLTLARAHSVQQPARDDQHSVDGEPPSPVHLAVELGRLLERQGPAALDRLRPRSVLYVHLDGSALAADAPAVARVEEHGPVSHPQLAAWLGHDRITVRPVVTPHSQSGVEDYQLPRPLEEALVLTRPREIFPYGTLPSRQADKDHTTPYDAHRRTGPPQTSLDNLGPLSRRHHRAKTHGGFTCHQPIPGTYYWRLPSGRWYRHDRLGTQPLDHRDPPVIAQLDSHDERSLTLAERRLHRIVTDLAT
jgi:hypothetical protein